ncbi:MAG: NADH-quinone oxidoreductase subunit J [Actinomycetes bacterium]
MFVTVLFVVFAAIALGSAIAVVISRNPVHSALWLVGTLLAIAGFFVLQKAYLLSAVQVIVYASAIVVLFLFVIMLLGVDREESLGDPLRIQRPLAIGLGLIGFVLLVGIMGNRWATGAQTVTGPLRGGSGGNVEHVARALFTTYLWPFELTSALLVVGVVGGVALARRSNAEEEEAA